MAKAKKGFGDLFEDAMNDTSDDISATEPAIQTRKVGRGAGRMVRKTVLVSKIKRNPLNRYNLSRDEKYMDLIKGIERLGGAMEDIICQPEDEEGFYYIISGERRWLALQEAGVEETPIKIVPERVTGSDELVEIMNANSGRRGDYPYDIPRSLKDYYALLAEEGITDTQEQKEMAWQKLSISSERTFRNYNALSELPVDVLEAGRSGYLTRDEGLALSAALSNEKGKSLGEETAARIIEIAASDDSTEIKTKKCKNAIADMSKKLNRKAERAETLKKPNVYSAIKRIGKLTTIEEYSMPRRKEEKEKMRALIETSIEFLNSVREKLEESEKKN